MQAHPQKFWFVDNPGKIREILGKICETVHKIPEILGKLSENTDKNENKRCLFWKIGAQRGEIHMKTFLYDLCGRKYQLQEFPENFLGKFGDIRAKIFRTPKHLPAPTPMSQTHTHTHTHHNLFENQTVK